MLKKKLILRKNTNKVYILFYFDSNYNILFEPNLSITYNNVVLQIGSPCSGSVGIGLFLSLIVFFLYFEYENINKKEFIIYALIGIIGMYLITVLRIIILSLLILKYQQREVIEIFHSNLGFFLYATYSIIYLNFMYPKVIKKKKKKNINN